jgi:hypothetical protein
LNRGSLAAALHASVIVCAGVPIITGSIDRRVGTQRFIIVRLAYVISARVTIVARPDLTDAASRFTSIVRGAGVAVVAHLVICRAPFGGGYGDDAQLAGVVGISREVLNAAALDDARGESARCLRAVYRRIDGVLRCGAGVARRRAIQGSGCRVALDIDAGVRRGVQR